MFQIDDRMYSFEVVSRQGKTEEDTQKNAEHQREANESHAARKLKARRWAEQNQGKSEEGVKKNSIYF